MTPSATQVDTRTTAVGCDADGTLLVLTTETVTPTFGPRTRHLRLECPRCADVVYEADEVREQLWVDYRGVKVYIGSYWRPA